VAALDIADRVALVLGDVVGLGRLLCALVASWTPRGAIGSWNADDNHTVELARLLADPGAAVSMREAHALLVGPERDPAARGTGGIAARRAVCGPRRRQPDDRERHARAGSAAGQAVDHVSDQITADQIATDGSATDVTPTEVAPTDGSGSHGSGTQVSPSPDPRPDQLGGHLGRYRILTRLGCGGMGEVFLAEDPALRRGVAIKRIRPGLARDRTFRARLRREAQLAARLSHRAIVQVFDLITHDNVDHMVMEYVPGPSLHTLLAGSPMPIAEAVRITAELADGLAYAHQQGVVHRDLKLENILISIDGQPKIADFGIARRATTVWDHDAREPLTGDGLMVGTSRAMSPEQIEGLDVDARSDLFSFGVLLYELVTGTSPFATSSDAMTLLRVLHEPHAPAGTQMPAVPHALSALIDRLLEKDPAERPDSARAVRDQLRRVLDDALEPLCEPRDAPRTTPAPAGLVPNTGVAVDTGAAAAGVPSTRAFAGQVAAAAGTGAHDRAVLARNHEVQRLLGRDRQSRIAGGGDPDGVAGGAGVLPRGIDRQVDRGPGLAARFACDPGIGRFPSTPRNLRSKIQAPFVLAEIRALRSSIFKRSPEVQSALAIADKVEHAYKLDRADLFIPAFETFCAILEPFATTVLTGTVRRIGYEIFPQYVSILGIPASNVRAAMDLKTGADLVRLICDAYSRCIVGTDAGTLSPTVAGSRATVTDTTFMPCQLQMGVFLGAGKLTGLFKDNALTEKRCRARGDDACVYELAL
jgi:serine/threonine-protein kinase